MENILELAKKEFGLQLKKYRKAAGISQKFIADCLNKHQSYFPSVEKGVTGIGFKQFVEISILFGVKYYQLADPDFAMPTKKELRDNIKLYVKSNKTDTAYLSRFPPNYSANIDIYLNTDQLKTAKSSVEIADDYYQMFEEQILPSKVTDILKRSPRSDKLIITASGKINIYQLKSS